MDKKLNVKQRLDDELVKRKIFPSKNKAQAAVMAGIVKVNGSLQTKSGKGVGGKDVIELIKPSCPFVSRGGLKLQAGLKNFGISCGGKICVDIGTATGGFTDCFLQNGAELVYSVDVGKGQIDAKLLKNPRVRFFPETNARFLKTGQFMPAPQVCAIDVSFISLKLVLPPVISIAAQNSDIIALIKPQFELSKKETPGGVVKSDELRNKAVSDLQQFLKSLNIPKLKDNGVIPSPIKGAAKGNIEFLWHIKIS